jgi:DtxR family transcriptional regulator, Mn-dependent transcriptional regulator
MTKSEEDYIKFLYQPSPGERDVIKLSTIAKAFGYTEQSVNEMMKRLSEKKLIEYIPYKGVYLTPIGHELALKMIRAHRIWEVFLYEKLGYDWDEVHAISEILEHTNREDVVDRLYNYLNQPERCPHGNRISPKGTVPQPDQDTPLHITTQGTTFEVHRVDDSPELLNFLSSLNVKLGSTLSIESIDSFNEIIYISIHNKTYPVAFKNASRIFGLIR